MDRDLVNILGYGVDRFSLPDAVDYITKNGGLVVTLNPEMISEASKNPAFSDVITKAELVIPDGVGIQIGLKLLGNDVKRIAGIDFAYNLLEYASQNGKSVALIGAKPNIISLAVDNLKRQMPSLNIIFSSDGYFTDDNKVLSEVIATKPDIVLAALGSPKQEMFLNTLKNNLPDAVLIGVGGSFDVWSGVVARAPKIFQILGLEWLYRTLNEPKRFKRIFPTLPLFVLKVIKERLFN